MYTSSLRMTVVKPISSLGVSYFTSMWTLRRIVHPHLTLIKRFKIQRKERKSVISNITKLITQTNSTINPGDLPTTKTKFSRKMIRYLGPTSKIQIHIEKNRQQTTCKTSLASLKTKPEKSFTVATLKSQSKSWRRQGGNNKTRIVILKNTTNNRTLKIWLSRLRPPFLTTC